MVVSMRIHRLALLFLCSVLTISTGSAQDEQRPERRPGDRDEPESRGLREREGREREGDRRRREPPEELRRRFDADGDGELDEKERDALRSFMRERFGSTRGGRRRGPRNERMQLVDKFDKDKNGRLSDAERAVARKHVKETRAAQGGRGGPGRGGPGRRGPGRGGPPRDGGAPGDEPREREKVAVKQAESYPGRGLYDSGVLRTLFLTFAQKDWEEELSDFYRTDVEVPADLVVDGASYRSIGVRFRGNSSFSSVPAGKKRSFNISIDHADDAQRLLGYKTLNLLNSNADPSFLREILFDHVSREYIGAARANLVKVVINGESWGVYVNVQQFNKELLEESFGTRGGARWKISQGRGGGARSLRYDGDDPEVYKRSLSLKTEENADESWAQLIRFTKVLDETPPGQVIEKLDPVLAIDEALWYIAIENIFTDEGYVSRGADYLVYLDPAGRFHLLTTDNNETFGLGAHGPGGGGRRPGGGGRRPGDADRRDRERRSGEPGQERRPGDAERERGRPEPGRERRPGDAERDRPGGERERGRPEPGRDRRPGGAEQGRDGARGRGGPADRGGPGQEESHEFDPLAHEKDPERPIISKLLAVPELRARYFAHVRTIAETWLDWKVIGPIAEGYRERVGDEIAKDVTKLYPTEAFVGSIEGDVPGRRRPVPGLKSFVEKRRAFLLGHAQISKPRPRIASVQASVASGSAPAPKDSVTVRAEISGDVKPATVLLYHSNTVRGPFERVEMKADGGTYAARIPASPAGTVVRYYVEARASDEIGSTAFHPAKAESGPLTYLVQAPSTGSSAVRINEVMASNRSSHADPQGQHDDWIELHNPSGRKVDLSKLYLSDDPKSPRKWKFPAATSIAPGGYLVVWADNDGADKPGLHASFKISKEGGQVLLIDADASGNGILDSVVFSSGQRADRSLGRVPDGSGGFRVLRGTPGGSNRD